MVGEKVGVGRVVWFVGAVWERGSRERSFSVEGCTSTRFSVFGFPSKSVLLPGFRFSGFRRSLYCCCGFRFSVEVCISTRNGRLCLSRQVLS